MNGTELIVSHALQEAPLQKDQVINLIVFPAILDISSLFESVNQATAVSALQGLMKWTEQSAKSVLKEPCQKLEQRIFLNVLLVKLVPSVMLTPVLARNAQQELMKSIEGLAPSVLTERLLWKEQKIDLNALLAQLGIFLLQAQAHARSVKQAFLNSTELIVMNALQELSPLEGLQASVLPVNQEHLLILQEQKSVKSVEQAILQRIQLLVKNALLEPLEKMELVANVLAEAFHLKKVPRLAQHAHQELFMLIQHIARK